MKTLLLYPASDREDCFKYIWHDCFKYNEDKYYPMAVAYLAAGLEKAGHNVEVMVNVPAGQFMRRFIKKHKTFASQVIGITCLTSNRQAVFRILGYLDKLGGRKPLVVLGGIHSTYMYEQMLNNFPAIDYIILGEGDLIFPGLLDAVQKKDTLENIPGLVFRDKKGAVSFSGPVWIKDIDLLPQPSHHLFEGILNTYKIGNILATRGCPNCCIFCCQSPHWYHNYRLRNPRSIADEMEYLYRRYSIRFLNFADDTLTADRDWTVRLCHEIKEKRMRLPWFGRTTIESLDEEIIRYLKEAKCCALVMGIETGNEKLSKDIGKCIDRQKVIAISRILDRNKIRGTYSFSVGNPGENFYSIRDTLSLIDRMSISSIKVYTTTISVGSRLYRRASEEKKYIDSSFWLTAKPSPLFTEDNPQFVLMLYRVWIIFFYCFKKKRLKSLLHFFCEIFLQVRFFINDILIPQRPLCNPDVNAVNKKI